MMISYVVKVVYNKSVDFRNGCPRLIPGYASIPLVSHFVALVVDFRPRYYFAFNPSFNSSGSRAGLGMFKIFDVSSS